MDATFQNHINTTKAEEVQFNVDLFQIYEM